MNDFNVILVVGFICSFVCVVVYVVNFGVGVINISEVVCYKVSRLIDEILLGVFIDYVVNVKGVVVVVVVGNIGGDCV